MSTSNEAGQDDPRIANSEWFNDKNYNYNTIVMSTLQ